MIWLRGSPSVGRPKQNPDVDRLLAARTAAPSTLERVARVSRGVVAGICWLLLVGAGAAAAEKMSLPRILLVEALLLLLLGAAVVAPSLSLGAQRRGAVVFWGVAALLFAGGETLGRVIQVSDQLSDGYRWKPVGWQSAPFQGIRFEVSGDSYNATVLVDVDGRQVAHIGGMLQHAADVPLPPGPHKIRAGVSRGSGPEADVVVETQSLTKVQIPVTVGRSRLVGIRTIETEVAVHIQPAAPSKGEWIGVRENLVHRSSRPRDLSLLRLLVVSAAVAVAVGWASRRRRH